MDRERPQTRLFVVIFAVLLVLVGVTVVVAWYDLGRWNFIVATVIAFFKAVLIAIYFMDIRESRPLTKIVVVAGLLWLAILFTFALADYWTRNQLT